MPALGALKFSLHESGVWQIAFNRHYHERKTEEGLLEGKDRWLDRWRGPEGGEPTAVLRIIIPAAAANIPMDQRFEGKDVQWIESPGSPLCVEIDLVLADDGHTLEEFRGTSWDGVLASDILPSGDHLWLIHRVARLPAMPSPMPGKLNPLRRPQPDLREEAKLDGLRMLVFGVADGVRFFIESAAAAREADE